MHRNNMKIQTEHTLGPLSCERTPRIDVDNGEGFIEMFEVSKELEGGDWEDVAYCFSKENARLFAAAPALLEALRAMIRLHYDEGKASIRGLDTVNKAEATIRSATNKT